MAQFNVRYRAQIAKTAFGRNPTLAEHIQIGLPLNSGLHRAASDVRLKPGVMVEDRYPLGPFQDTKKN